MKKKIIFAGGGTGGHVYPALSIARELQSISPEFEIHFVGTKDGFEAKLVPQEGFQLSTIPVGKLNMSGNFLGKLKTLLLLPLGFLKSVFLLRELNPEIVVGVGGYASGPFVLMAACLGYRTAIWEPNAHPGLTNRWLSRFVDACFIVFDESKKLLHSNRVIRVGLPVRRDIEELGESIDQRKMEVPKTNKFHLLVFGGSQGARAINRVVFEYMQKFGFQDSSIELIHQVGKVDFAELDQQYRGKDQVQCHEFLNPMKKYYEWADLIICRSGASTVAEIMAARKLAVFIPLPWAADDHQRKNAESLVNLKAAWMLEQKDLSPDTLHQLLQQIRAQTQRELEMLPRLQKAYSPRAAAKTAQLIVDMMDQEG